MLRRILEEFGLILIPFGFFLVYLVLAGRNALLRVHWDRHLLRLVIAGLAVVIGSFVYEGLFSERRAGGYVPTHMENGRPVPGAFR